MFYLREQNHHMSYVFLMIFTDIFLYYVQISKDNDTPSSRNLCLRNMYLNIVACNEIFLAPFFFKFFD